MLNSKRKSHLQIVVVLLAASSLACIQGRYLDIAVLLTD